MLACLMVLDELRSPFPPTAAIKKSVVIIIARGFYRRVV